MSHEGREGVTTMQEPNQHSGTGWFRMYPSALVRISVMILLFAGCNGGDSAPPPPTTTSTVSQNTNVAGQWALSWVPANLSPSEACHMNVTLAPTGDIVTTDVHGLQGPQKGTSTIKGQALTIVVAGYTFNGTLDSSGKTATGTMTNLNSGEVTPGSATRV